LLVCSEMACLTTKEIAPIGIASIEKLMASSEPGWELCRSFLAVLREGSLSAAARHLGLTQPTIGHHIDQLEAALAVPLFTRSQRGLAPTEAAHALRPHAETMAAAAEALVRAASGGAGEMRGAVRVTASEIIGAEVLPTMLTDFRQLHPEIVVELSLSNRTEDLLRRDADIAVRMVRPVQGSLVAGHLGSIVLGLHAHRRYIDANGHPESLDDLYRHTLIGFDQETTSIRAIQELGLAPLRRDAFALRTDSHLAQLAAIRAGFGIGVCQVGIARRDSDLVRVLRGSFAPKLETWIVMHQDLCASCRARAMFDHLAAALSFYVRTGD
jgi:DNA-binding transcriptional LysR family regulator